MFDPLTAALSPILPAGIAGLVGAVVGRWTAGYADRFSRETAGHSLSRHGRTAVVAATALLFAAFVVAAVHFNCQRIEQVRPSDFWRFGRVVYHLVLIGLLLAATLTDLVDYVIPDRITFAGMAVGLFAATLSGDLQMVHLWIDWNQVDQIVDGRVQWGAYVPAWIAAHPHWHGLAWSAAGLIAGAGATWLLRATASLLLGREALGLGDVTLMGMIGSFIGWQPMCFVFLLAPLCAVVVGLAVRLSSGRTFLAFGPYLALAALVVLFTWRWLWRPTREIFGHPPTLALLAGGALVLLIALLTLLRLYRAIPVERH